jgi:SAM-dependent methyltransferase
LHIRREAREYEDKATRNLPVPAEKIARKVRAAQRLPFPGAGANGNGKPDAPGERPESAYDPLPSVWEGTDAELIERMLDFYPRHVPAAILDATVNAGRFWRGSKRPVTGLDIDPRHKPDVVGDNTDMPFADGSFDVVVYDPPHVPNQGRDKQKDFNTRFGLVVKSSAKQGYNFSHTFPPFCREAYRVLRPEGILLCKIADYVHNHRYQWAHVELLNAAVAAGFTACDCIVKVRKGPITDPKWKTAHHARRQHCYWLVLRKSKKCE